MMTVMFRVGTLYGLRLLFISFCVTSAAYAGANASTTACTSASSAEVRVVQVIYESKTSAIPCKVMYEKDGVESELASAKNTAGFCEKTERKVVGNLVQAGWQCEHRLTGSAIEPNRDIKLDLFLEEPVQGIQTKRPSLDSPAVPAARFALTSKALVNEQQAHKLSAELKRHYPNLISRVAAFGSGLNMAYRVVVGASRSREELEAMLPQLDDAVREQFPITDYLEISDTTVYLPNDYSRYVIAQCIFEGQTSVANMARCSGYKLDKEMLLACLNGGVCVPMLVAENDSISDFPGYDLIEAIDAIEPAVAARAMLNLQVERCQLLTVATPDSLAECIASYLLHPDQRFIVDCHLRHHTTNGLLDCMGGKEVLDITQLYERCAVSKTVNMDCLLEMTSNDFVNRSAACLDAGSHDAISRCAILANVDTDRTKTLKCLGNFSHLALRAGCIANSHLNLQQAALLECSVGSPSLGKFGLCAARILKKGTAAQRLTSKCLLNGHESAIALLSCSGGRFAAAELENCLHSGTVMASCFRSRTILTSAINGKLDHFLSSNNMNHQIADFRQALYVSQGGDLFAVLADSDNSKWLELTDKNVNKNSNGKIRSSETEKAMDSFDRFGFDK